MKFLLVALFLVSSGMFLSTRGSTSFLGVSNSPEVEQVRNLEIQMCDLLVHGDMEGYAEHVADDYVRIAPDGSMTSKADVLRAFQKYPIVAMDPSDMRIRVYGDAAVLNVALTWKQRWPQGVATTRSRITKTFIKHNARWILVSLVETPLQNQP